MGTYAGLYQLASVDVVEETYRRHIVKHKHDGVKLFLAQPASDGSENNTPTTCVCV